MSKAATIIAILGIVLSAFLLSYIFYFQAIWFPAKKDTKAAEGEQWIQYQIPEFHVSSSTDTIVPNLIVDFNAKSDGVLNIYFDTNITNEPLGEVIFKIRLDDDVLFTSETFKGSVTDEIRTNTAISGEDVKDGDHTVDVTVYGNKGTSGIYNAILIVSLSIYE